MVSMHRAAALVCLLLALTVAFSSPAAASPHKKVLLKDVSAITLSATAQTTGRRSPPVPQLTCVGGPCKYAPTTVLCSNAGFDGSDVLWKCKADLEKGIKLGDISVVCEGYDYPDDPYILHGSCGLEYTLTGRAQVESQQQYHHHQTDHNTNHHRPQSDSSSVGTLFMFGICAFIAYVLYKSCTEGNGAHRGGSGGGGGGGGGYPGGGPGGPFSRGGSAWASSNCPPAASSSSSYGFGSGLTMGLAGGSALGYMAGSRNQSQ